MVGLRDPGYSRRRRGRTTKPVASRSDNTKVPMNRYFRFALALGALLTAGSAAAQDPQIQQIHDTLAKRLPPHMMGPISPSPVPGLYEMQQQSRLIYVSADGRFIIQGEIFDLQETRNITKDRQRELRVDAVAQLGEDNMLVYEPKQARYEITVFTDIDCPYCRKMHGDMAGYLERGIRVRYLFYPRSGKNTPSYDKAVSVWCADDRKAAMDAAMSGGNLAAKRCANPVDAHLDLGEELRIGGTPAVVLAKGTLVPGYLPPDRLVKEIELREFDAN